MNKRLLNKNSININIIFNLYYWGLGTEDWAQSQTPLLIKK
jgi:hypothetical protein